MVVYPNDYSLINTDDELTLWNNKVSSKKKKKAKNMPDVERALNIANHLLNTIPLNNQVCHNLRDEVEAFDFVFSEGSGWLDPGTEFKWKSDLQIPLPSNV